MDLQMYWHIDYWDVPLNGVAMYKSRPATLWRWSQQVRRRRGRALTTLSTNRPTPSTPHELEARHEELGWMVGWYTDHRPERHGRWVDTEAGREWYNNEAARPFSFDPLRDCPKVATVPSYAVEWFFAPRL